MSKQIEDVMELVTSLWDSGNTRESWDVQCSKYEAIKAKLRELLPVWQPIESAPKSEDARVLVWNGEEVVAAYRDMGCWANAFDHSGCFVSPEPTYWMPLPEPPSQEGAT